MAPSKQNHHFIPRFILKNFAPEDQPPAGPANRSQKNKMEKRSDFLANKIDLERSMLTQRPVSTEFALVNMYRDPGFDENPYHLEKKFALLEGQVSEIVHRARSRFSQSLTLELNRIELDRLRKFLFLMKYRNSGMFDRYNHDHIDEYQADDREKILSYMESSGFQKPRDVWFDNLRRFLDVNMDPERNWMNTLKTQMYPDDAMMMELHLIGSFIAFCEPSTSEDEFLLTQNAYCIFEGPSTEEIHPITRKVESNYTEYHNFAPLSPKLIIVLRSHLLPSQGQDSDGLRKLREQFAVLIQSQHLHPDKAGSILQDLPIHPCHTIYAAPDITSATSLRASFRENDRFQFQCFKLPSRHMTIINNLLLEEAYLTSSIVYHSRESLKANLENYMKADIYGMKAIFDPQEKRHVFLTTLEKICRDLGSSVSCRKTVIEPSFPPDEGRMHMSSVVALEVGIGLLKISGIERLLPRAYLLLKPGMIAAMSILSFPN
ncbi:hypothetical protein N7537_009117 [Penicillium hordei]|uniref:DUF4238 domain-containing protein n=1 Tax=Penicillium hordei TaxID=40994 RepID=A0AAD6GVF7_9EURO|nr:uncharacterized protein N7537_009117 [Penicillium hordei]KAJ5592213.1 hypothetical protein N7537_009117 [Penicillium hordei]